MNKFLSSCVRFLQLFVFLAVIFQSLGAAESSSASLAVSQTSSCLLARSQRVSDDLAASLRDALENSAAAQCKLLDSTLEQPFFSGSDSLWGNADSKMVLGLWLTRSIDGRELVVRGFDFESKLQFGMGKATTHNLTSDSAQETFLELINDVLEQFPYIGYLEGQEFFSWGLKRVVRQSRQNMATVELHSTHEFKRHPFLPIQLENEKSSYSMGKAVFRDDHLMFSKALSKELHRALDEKKRLWLKLVNE